MSLETILERMATALETIAAGTQPLTAPPPPTKLAAVPSAPPVPTPAPTPAPAPVATPAPAPAVRWASQNEVNTYVMGAFKEMGPEKGAQIGTILNEMGLKAVTELQPEHYEGFFQKVEALKNA